MRALIAREYRIRLDPAQFALLRDRLGIQSPAPAPGSIKEELDEDFYAYINSPIGREVARREQEFRERDERERAAIPRETPLLSKPDKEQDTEGKSTAGVTNTMKATKRGPNFQKPKRRNPKKRR